MNIFQCRALYQNNDKDNLNELSVVKTCPFYNGCKIFVRSFVNAYTGSVFTIILLNTIG
jgi:hypothetical protein